MDDRNTDWNTDWEGLLEQVAAEGSRDIVDVLREARRRDPRLGTFQMRAALCAKKVFALTMRQAHAVAGWFAGEVTDDELRATVSLDR
ncbi:hypothetical protein ACFXDH_36580 [Streptomyces sp. NPDC059467]|uniref:hypothetical protein n=1 Tax=Streptomyces sp. NPDC059467 TaxID=3346844 RepID=UPI00367C2685